MIIPAKQRVRIGVHFRLFPSRGNFRTKRNIRTEETTPEGNRESYLNTKTSNLNGFAAFDLQKRYEIDFANGWQHPK